jgi:predicted phosphodiesterase
MDPEKVYRDELIKDARSRTTEVDRPASAILVGGDVAFRGILEEYKAAFEWLQKLADACGCPLGRVFVIPGNHDVNRAVITNTPTVRNAQRAISTAPAHKRYNELFEQFQDPDASRALLAPISAYNDFAAQFRCQIYTPEQLFWHQDLPLDDNTTLRIYGLTSTLLSGADGRDDTRESLYVSPLQTILERIDGVVNLAMCHHPPDWLIDGDDVDDAFCGRASIHLFGHKHRQRITRETKYIRFSAGAVNPDPNEHGWQPGYNLIDLAVRESQNGSRMLDIEALLLGWQTAPPMFVPIAPEQGETLFRHSVPIRGRLPTPTASPATSSSIMVEVSEAPIQVPAREVEMSEDRTRNLILRFWSLPASKRREIALRLKLIEEIEMKLPEPERYGRALVRAGQRNQLEEVAEAVEKEEAH